MPPARSPAASSSSPSRTVVLRPREPRLTERAPREAPGIFNWALAGLDRLLERGHFVQPDSAKEALQHFEDLGSPVGASSATPATSAPASRSRPTRSSTHWKPWCTDEGRPYPGTKAMFVKDLRAVAAGIRPIRRRDGDGRRRLLHGITLHSNSPPDPGPARPGTRPTPTGRAGPGPATVARGSSPTSPRTRSSGSPPSSERRIPALVRAPPRRPTTEPPNTRISTSTR